MKIYLSIHPQASFLEVRTEIIIRTYTTLEILMSHIPFFNNQTENFLHPPLLCTKN